jgi:hypothetical protein
MYGLPLLKLSNFLCGNIMDKYMFSHHFVNFFDQILIFLLLLCGNLEKESLNCPSNAVQFFIYLEEMDYNGKYEPSCNFLQLFISYYMHMRFSMELISITV